MTLLIKTTSVRLEPDTKQRIQMLGELNDTFKLAMGGKWEAGVTVLGLAQGGVDWALDDNNAKLITPDMKAKVEAAKADIISGKIKVHDYMSNNSCAY